MADPGAGIELRPPTPDDLPGIGELYRIVKGRPRPEQVTRHRFFDTPWGDSLSLIALDGDRVVSAALVWPVMLRVGSEVVLGGQGTDAVTHPDYRGRPRLFLSLARTIKSLLPERGIDVYYTFPNERSVKLTKYVAARTSARSAPGVSSFGSDGSPFHADRGRATRQWRTGARPSSRR